MRKYIFPFFLLLSGLLISAVAAYYSIFGLSKLFSGSAFAVTIMAIGFEVAKLFIASTLNNYWKSLHFFKRLFFVFSLIVLIAITSIGVYGFLSAAYQSTANVVKIEQKKFDLVEQKKKLLENTRLEYLNEKESAIDDISYLRSILDSKTEFIDKKTGQKIATSSQSVRKSIEKQLDDAISQRNSIDAKVSSLNDSISKSEIILIELESSSTVSAELGPLQYISNVSGYPMDEIVNYLLLTIVLVFDPLAIVIILIANDLFRKIKFEENTPSQSKDVVIKTDSDNVDIENVQLTSQNSEEIEIEDDDQSTLIILNESYTNELISGNLYSVKPNSITKDEQFDILASALSGSISNTKKSRNKP